MITIRPENETESTRKLTFRPIDLSLKAAYDALPEDGHDRGSEFSFANLYLWGEQSIAETDGFTVVFSRYGRLQFYLYPIGVGDAGPAIDAILEDAKARGIPAVISGLDRAAIELLESRYGGAFRLHSDEGNFDYVYRIDDLADLAGKKYHGKRNHIHRFEELYPNAAVEPIDETNLAAVRAMLSDWYAARRASDPEGNYSMEEWALSRALRDRDALALEGLVLRDGETVLAFTFGSRLSRDTFDVHFEKARPDAEGAYAAINRAFARAVREKYPEVRFLNREEDMGIEGLRKAKQSYRPCRLVEKKWVSFGELPDGEDESDAIADLGRGENDADPN